jgi:hypothetical protein
MQDLVYELPRKPIPRCWVNKGQEEEDGAESALRLVASSSHLE